MFSEDALNPFREKFPENNRVRSGDVWGQGHAAFWEMQSLPAKHAWMRQIWREA